MYAFEYIVVVKINQIIFLDQKYCAMIEYVKPDIRIRISRRSGYKSYIILSRSWYSRIVTKERTMCKDIIAM